MNIVHVVGCGTIGEPLTGLLIKNREALGIDEVTFYKRSARVADRAKLESLVRSGGRLAVDGDQRDAFLDLGHTPDLDARQALERATVVIDCSPCGLDNKNKHYAGLRGPKGFIAQGSEHGFGKPYARGINDRALVAGEDRFLHVVSCNTHNLSALVRSLAIDPTGRSHLRSGRFVCMRRANDISQDDDFVPGPTVGKHDEQRFGTHHARDAHSIFATLGYDLPLWSSAIKLNTQYMHSIWFSLELDRPTDLDEVKLRFAENPHVALTYKRSANSVFSFGRDHGLFGRILSQTVIPVDSLALRGDREVVGFCFTPQDGNSLLSSVAGALWLMDPKAYGERLAVLWPYLFQEV